MKKNPIPKFFSLNIFAGLLITFLPVFSLAQMQPKNIEEAARPFLRKYIDSNGLPSNSVMTIERDLNGFLWVGTQDGAAFFNGHRWTSVNLPNKTISNYVYSILAAQDGVIWIATDGGGLHKYFNGEWKTYDTTSGLISNNLRFLYETYDENGQPNLLIGTRDGLSRFDGEHFENFSGENNLPKTPFVQ